MPSPLLRRPPHHPHTSPDRRRRAQVGEVCRRSPPAPPPDRVDGGAGGGAADLDVHVVLTAPGVAAAAAFAPDSAPAAQEGLTAPGAGAAGGVEVVQLCERVEKL